jgi:hypothetical protein
MIVGIRTVAEQFLSCEHLFRMFGIVSLCTAGNQEQRESRAQKSTGTKEPRSLHCKNVPLPFPAPSQDVMDHKLFLIFFLTKSGVFPDTQFLQLGIFTESY